MDNPVAWFGLFIAFVGVFYLGKLMGEPKPKKNIKTPQIKDLYCFECEIEKPVAIAKNGRTYCTNCKLYH